MFIGTQNLSSKQKSLCSKDLQEVIQESDAFKKIKNTSSGEVMNSEEASIDVSQVPLNMTEDTLFMIFESKRYGGGEIKCLKFDQLQQRAVITFTEPAGINIDSKSILKLFKNVITFCVPIICCHFILFHVHCIGVSQYMYVYNKIINIMQLS